MRVQRQRTAAGLGLILLATAMQAITPDARDLSSASLGRIVSIVAAEQGARLELISPAEWVPVETDADTDAVPESDASPDEMGLPPASRVSAHNRRGREPRAAGFVGPSEAPRSLTEFPVPPPTDSPGLAADGARAPSRLRC